MPVSIYNPTKTLTLYPRQANPVDVRARCRRGMIETQRGLHFITMHIPEGRVTALPKSSKNLIMSMRLKRVGAVILFICVAYPLMVVSLYPDPKPSQSYWFVHVPSIIGMWEVSLFCLFLVLLVICSAFNRK